MPQYSTSCQSVSFTQCRGSYTSLPGEDVTFLPISLPASVSSGTCPSPMCGMHPISRVVLGERGCLLLASSWVLRDLTVPRHPGINSDCALGAYAVRASRGEAPGNAVRVDAHPAPFATLPSVMWIACYGLRAGNSDLPGLTSSLICGWRDKQGPASPTLGLLSSLDPALLPFPWSLAGARHSSFLASF